MQSQACMPPTKPTWSLWNSIIGSLDANRHDAAAIVNGALDKFDYVDNWVNQIEWEHNLAETFYAIEEASHNPTEDQSAAEVVVVVVLIVAL